MIQHQIIGDDMQTVSGRVWLQTLPFSRLADRVHAAFRGDREDVKRDLGGMLGGLIGGDRSAARYRERRAAVLRCSVVRTPLENTDGHDVP